VREAHSAEVLAKRARRVGLALRQLDIVRRRLIALQEHTRCRRALCWDLGDAISGRMKLLV
jgi:hypothetical protein